MRIRGERKAAARLEALGLDAGFLEWLEGEDERLARTYRAGAISAAKYGQAIRAAVWMTSLFANPRYVERDLADEWKERYQFLERLLWNGLQWSMTTHKYERPQDVAVLEEVLNELLPSHAAQSYVDDLRRLRKLGQPVRFEEIIPRRESRPPKTGGPRQAEQVQRMRAAVFYLKTKSPKPYRDLAELWNERLGEARYNPETMRQTLRKGEQASEQLLEFWRRMYEGQLDLIYPSLDRAKRGKRSSNG